MTRVDGVAPRAMLPAAEGALFTRVAKLMGAARRLFTWRAERRHPPFTFSTTRSRLAKLKKSRHFRGPMKKPSPQKKTVAPKTAKTKKNTAASKPAAKKSPAKKAKPAAVSTAATARAQALEKHDAKAPPKTAAKKTLTATSAAKPERNADFPNTYIALIHVSLNDPVHAMTLTWTGPQASAQETGPFHTSPGAGVRGINCEDPATSRRTGTNCTPKGTRTVEGFAAHLNSDARAVFVTWFMQARGIALHYFPSVPNFAASHGCVRIEIKRIARLIQENSRIGLTKVTVDGTWTKPAKQH